ncbi:phosphotransferase family protein [Microlunatus elymi]|nr:aminoglycoside phosphotransferase family protein [Microlunatus elymi]
MARMSDWPNSSVRERHAAVSTSPDVLRSLVRRATGDDLDQVARIVEGYDNEVYRVRTRSGQRVFVRIRRFGGGLESAKCEARMIERARSVGVPGPEILLLDQVRIDATDYPVMVQRGVPGRALIETYGTLTREQRRRSLSELGSLIARLNSLRADADWRDGFRTEIGNRRDERAAVLSAGFGSDEFAAMITALEGYVDHSSDGHAAMCHGDLGPRHIFLDPDGSISGVIDFGDTHPAAPLHDLAVLRVRGSGVGGAGLDLAPVLTGYGALTTPDFRRRLDLHTLMISLSSLGIGVDEGDEACIFRETARIRTLLKEIRR